MEAPELQRMATQFTHEKQQGQGKLGSGVVEQFMVEDLLDFSNEDGDEEGGDVGLLEAVNSSADSSTVTAAMDYCSSNSSSGYGCGGGSGGGPCLSSELCVPYDEIAELEWLSNIVEESFSTEDLQKLQLISGVKSSSSSDISTPTTADNLTANSDTFAPEKTVVPGKARSKRSRTAPVNWTSRILLLPGTYTANTALPESELLGPPPSKAAKTVKKKENSYDGLIPAPDGRKCLHCATDKTPQWRTGPLGPKTLCNACGVRYKSGRLVPEYRPAASPTFVVSKHSNSHRKVLELRRQKEMVPHQNPQFVHHHHTHSNGAMFDSSVTVTGGGGDEFLIHHHHQQHLGSDFRQLI